LGKHQGAIIDEQSDVAEGVGSITSDAMTRRRFLLAAGAATGAVWVAPSVISLSPALALTSPGPGDETEVEETDEDKSDEGETDEGDGDPDDDEAPEEDTVVLDRGITRRSEPSIASRAPSRATPASDVDVLGVSLSRGTPGLPRTGADRNALLGAGTTALAAGAALLRAGRTPAVAGGETPPVDAEPPERA
jgi:hypothetical protein